MDTPSMQPLQQPVDENLQQSLGSMGKDDKENGQFHDVNDADAKLTEQFGYQPVLKREFGYLSTFSFAVSISGLFSSVMSTFAFPLVSGGSAGVVWCWCISGIGCMCIACSVAELVSAYPTAGGLYFTISRLAPAEWVPSLSWITGWLNLLGQVAGVASSEYSSAQMLLAAISMSVDYEYKITTSMTVIVMAILMLVCAFVNSLSTYWMEKMTKTYVIFHMLVLFSCMVVLLVKTQDKHSASYVFTHSESETGWPSPGFSFLFGFLSVAWTMTDYDATAHITEEISEPEVKAPWAISVAMLFTYVAGFVFNIVLCFCMGDPSEILHSQTFQPVSQIFFNSLGKTGAIFYTVCGFIILQFVCFTAMQAAARSVFAFSRDGLVPFSKIWLRINRWTGTPLWAVWITAILCILINLIGLGSSTAIAGVFDVCAISLDLSYCIPIACKLLYGKFQPGPWHMGSLSWWVNMWSLIWTFFVSVIFLLPPEWPTTALNMNYASAYLVLIFVIAGIFWFVSGKDVYIGPVVETAREGIAIVTSEENSSIQDHGKSNIC